MYYHRLGLSAIEVEVLENFTLDQRDRCHLKRRCVTIKDLTEEHLPMV